jgi:hypothetical protein
VPLAVRRRRSCAVGAVVLIALAVAVAAIVDPAALHRHRATPPAASSTPIATATAALPSTSAGPTSSGSARGPIRLPYVTQSGAGTKASKAAVVHLDGRQVRLPASWQIASVSVAGPGALVYAVLSLRGTGPSLVAYVGPAGAVRTLPPLAAGALPLTADGSLVVGRATDSGPLVVVHLPSGAVVDRGPPLPSGYSIGGALGPRSILVEQDSTGAASIVDIPTGARTPVPQITQEWPVDAVSPQGQILLASDDGLRAIASPGSGGATWHTEATDPTTFAPAIDAGPEYSPDGSRIAVVTAGQLVIRSAADGSVLARSATLPQADQLGSLVWEDSGTVLLRFAAPTSGVTRSLSRCGATFAQCSPLAAPAGHLLIAFR